MSLSARVQAVVSLRSQSVNPWRLIATFRLGDARAAVKRASGLQSAPTHRGMVVAQRQRLQTSSRRPDLLVMAAFIVVFAIRCSLRESRKNSIAVAAVTARAAVASRTPASRGDLLRLPQAPTTTRQTATKTRTRQTQIHPPQGGEDRPLAFLRACSATRCVPCCRPAA